MKLFKGVALLVLLTIGSIEIQSSHASSSSELSGTPGPSRVPPALDCAEPFSCARIAELRATLKADPQQPDVLMALGAELDAIGDLAGARRAYRDALQLRPRDPLAFYHLSRTRIRERQLTERRDHGDAPARAKTEKARSALARAEALRAAGDHARALVEIRQSLKLAPSDPHTLVILGGTLFSLGDLEGAVNAYRAAIREAPAMTEAHMGEARALMAQAKWADAQAALEHAIRLDPGRVDAQYTLGSVQYTRGDVAGAIASYREALRLEPEFADARYQLALLLRLSGREEAATEEFLLAAGAGVPEARYFLGLAYLNGIGVERDHAEAIRWWWLSAEEQGVRQARDGLAQLRRRAFLEGEDASAEKELIKRGFRAYRESLWVKHPNLQRSGVDATVGASLLRLGRVQEAVPVLIKEAAALSVRSQRLLEALYEEGVEEQLDAYDNRILEYFEDAAAEGLPRPRLVVARMYGLGIGVPPDPDRALQLLEHHPEPTAADLANQVLIFVAERSHETPAGHRVP